MTLAALNLLAFAWHTVLELLEPAPGRPLTCGEAAVKRLSFFAHILMLTGAYVSLSLLAGFSQIPRHLLDPADLIKAGDSL